MKTFLCLLSLAGILTMTGCTVEEHGYRGGYYGPAEYGHAEVRVTVHHDHDWDDRGYWNRGHYYHGYNY